MKRQLITVALLGGVCLAPIAAQAQSAGPSTINLTGEVAQQCMLGSPDLSDLSFGDLTGPDGRLTTGLTGGGEVRTATIANAWCNTPSTLSVESEPMSMGAGAPAYATPAGFSRYITYDAKVTGWPTAIDYRPMIGDLERTTDANEPHAQPLVIEVSRLDTLNADGTAPLTGMVVEAGSYTGSVTLTLTVQ